MKRKIYNQLLKWKNERNGDVALLIEGARRIGKSYIVEDFAKNDWDCYQFCKQTIRNGDFQFYEGLRSFLRILNRKYGPEGEYFDVA